MWDLKETVNYYRKQGAPGDQSALVSLLKEVQRENGGAIAQTLLPEIGELLGAKESFLLAVIKRIPSLRLSNTHVLELCGGPNCSKRAALAEFIEKTYGKTPKGFAVREVPCMRLCGKGPNIRWDGKLYHGADENLIRSLVGEE